MFEAKAEAKALRPRPRPRPKFWPRGHFGLEDLTSLQHCQQAKYCRWSGIENAGETLFIVPPKFVTTNKASTTTTTTTIDGLKRHDLHNELHDSIHFQPSS